MFSFRLRKRSDCSSLANKRCSFFITIQSKRAHTRLRAVSLFLKIRGEEWKTSKRARKGRCCNQLVAPARLAACDFAVTVTVTLPRLFCFVVSAAHNGEFERFFGFCVVVTVSAKPIKSFEFAIVSHRNDIPHQPTDVILLIFLAYNKVVTRCKLDVSLRY